MSCEIHQPGDGVILVALRAEATVIHAKALHADLLRLADARSSLVIDAAHCTRVDAAILQLLHSAKGSFAGLRLRASSSAWEQAARRLGWPQPWP